MEGPCADSVEKREPASDLAIVVVDSLKRLTPTGRLEKRTHAVQRKTDPRGQLYIRLPTASTRTCASHKSKVGGDQLVRPLATASIDLGGNCINQVAV